MSHEEPAMREAFDKARASLDDFLHKAKAPPANTTGYAVKVGISDGRNIEYFWINQFAEKADGYSGQVNNKPRLVRNVKYGQNYVFSKAQIVDWVYFDLAQRRMQGNFTACALLTKEAPAEREAMKKRFGLECG